MDRQPATDTLLDTLLAAKFPHLRRSWLERINAKLGLLLQENGGNAEMSVRFKNGRDQWTDWSQRDLSPQD